MKCDSCERNRCGFCDTGRLKDGKMVYRSCIWWRFTPGCDYEPVRIEDEQRIKRNRLKDSQCTEYDLKRLESMDGLTILQVADVCKVSKATVRRWIGRAMPEKFD